METKLYQIQGAFAKRKGCLSSFVGVKLKETDRAVYLYGHGSVEVAQTGRCMMCGRALTHPVSVQLGIGPECGKHFHDWDAVGGYNLENINKLKTVVEGIIVDGWFPKSTVLSEDSTETKVDIPDTHPLITPATPKAHTAKMIVYKTTQEKGVKVEFPFNHEDLARVKSLAGRRWHSNERCWTCNLELNNINQLESWGFTLDDNLIKWRSENKVQEIAIDKLDGELVVPGLKGTLHPFQLQGVAFIEARKGRALLADEMGLGKTVQALAWLQLHPEARPAVIVTPASLKLNWERETNKWIDGKVQVLEGKGGSTHLDADVFIVNYDVFANKYKTKKDKITGKKTTVEVTKSGWVDYLLALKPQVAIFDESHYIKNSTAARTKSSKKLGKAVPYVIPISGTPIINRPVELYNSINLVEPRMFPRFFDYAKKYCNATHNGWGWDFTGASNTDELHELLTTSIMIRRLKKDVLPELPDKIRSLVPMELSNKTEYRRAEQDFISWVKEFKGQEAADKASQAEALVRIGGLKQLAVKGKLQQVVSWITDHLDTNGKLVVFAYHKNTIEHLMQELKQYNPVKVDGSVSAEGRQGAVDRFQNDNDCRLFVGNIKAAGVGLTLTAASSTATIELGWTPGEHDQAEDRVHRIGQEADSVNAYYLLAAGTIEEEIACLLDEKRKVIDQVLDGHETEETSLLTALMERYSE